MEIPDELIDQLLGEYQGPEQLTGPDGLINRLRRRLIERAAGAELEQHLGYPTGADAPFILDTNTIEALHRQIRKTIKTRGHFPTEGAARNLIYLAIINAQKSWKNTYNWSSALLAFKIHFGDRLP